MFYFFLFKYEFQSISLSNACSPWKLCRPGHDPVRLMGPSVDMECEGEKGIFRIQRVVAVTHISDTRFLSLFLCFLVGLVVVKVQRSWTVRPPLMVYAWLCTEMLERSFLMISLTVETGQRMSVLTYNQAFIYVTV